MGGVIAFPGVFDGMMGDLHRLGHRFFIIRISPLMTRNEHDRSSILACLLQRASSKSLKRLSRFRWTKFENSNTVDLIPTTMLLPLLLSILPSLGQQAGCPCLTQAAADAKLASVCRSEFLNIWQPRQIPPPYTIRQFKNTDGTLSMNGEPYPATHCSGQIKSVCEVV